MKVTFIHSRLSLGGAEKMAYEAIIGLDRTRFQIGVVCLYSPGAVGRLLLSKGINIVHSLMRDKYDLAGIYRLYSSLKKERPDVLYLESSTLVLFWGFICARLLKVPRMVTVIHTMRRPEKWERFKSGIINGLILRRLDRIGVASKVKLESLIKEYGLNPGRLYLIHNAVDTSRFLKKVNKNELKRKIGISQENRIVGMVGRLVTEKAYDVFLKAAQKVSSSIPDTKFLIIGEGQERARLENLTDILGLKERVIFLGERQDIPGLITLFDVAVLSSRTESFPVALLEYMAGQRPIVVTNVGDNSEIIRNGRSGIVVASEDPEAISEAVIGLLMDKTKAKTLGMNARKRAENRFSLDSMLRRIEDFFTEISSITDEKRIIMAGPDLKARGGISSFAKNCLCSEFPEGFDLVYHPTTVDGNKIPKSFFFIKSLIRFFIRLLTDKKIKVVHILTASDGSFYRKAILFLVSKLFKKATILHIHGAGFDMFYARSHPLGRLFIRKILDLSDSIIVLSKTWHSRVSRMTKNGNIKVIPNHVDLVAFSRISGKRDFSKMNVLTIGRLEHRKGTYDILDIVPVITKQIPDARFYIAGDGDVEKVRKICQKRGIDKNIILLGWLDKERLIEELDRATLFLLPSYNEGLPMAMLEAMASGLPVVSTRVGGIPELIEEGVNGFLVDPGQKEDLTKRLIGLLKDTELSRTMSKNNIEKIDSMFRLDRLANKFFDEYRDVISKNSGQVAMKKLVWYIRRLSCMSLEEVVYRMHKFICLSLHTLIRIKVDLDKVLSWAPKDRSFYFDTSRIELKREFLRLFPRKLKAILGEADELCAHKFKIFDLEWDAGKDIDWHRNYHDSKELRFIWELNRHQHLVTLGKAYLLSGDEKYAIEAREEILSWIRQNPKYKGINWASPLEVSLRLISWCWTYKFIDSSNVFSASAKRKFLEYIYLQAEFVRNNLSRYSSGNNHLIGEGCGLLVTALTFPGFKTSKDWLETGKKILFEEILNQVHPDGITKEQAFGYQGFVMEFFLLGAVLLEKNGIEISESSLNRFYAMADFVMNIMDAKGNVLHVGDSDNGRAIRLSSAKDVGIFKSLLASAGIISGRGDFKERGSTFGEDQFWLFGIEGLKRYKKIKSKKPDLHSRLFRQGGYAVFRKPSCNGKDSLLIMDCGELGYGSLAAHGHADLLSITLSSNGSPLLIDPGTYLYHTGNSWRDYFRGTSAHNTLTVNDKNQSEIKGPFMWGKRPMPIIKKWQTSDVKDFISASYANSGARHTRRILFGKKNSLWQISDFLDLKGQSNVRQYFHLSPGLSVKKVARNVIEASNKDVYLYIFTDKAFSTDIREGCVSPILGWSSSMFGSKIKSPTLVNSAVVDGKSEFVTFLYISDKKMRLNQVDGLRRHDEA